MKRIIITGVILSMLATPCYAESLWDRVPTKAKIATVAIGGVVTYGIISNPRGIFQLIIYGAKSQKAYTRAQHRAWVKLVKTGKPTINKTPKTKLPPDSRTWQEKLGDLK